MDFTASWCGPFRTMAPFLADLTKIYPTIIFAKVDVDELRSLATNWDVEVMPTFVFLQDRKILGNVAGAKELQATLEKHMAALS